MTTMLKMTFLLLVTVSAGCGDNLTTPPPTLPALEALPSCRSLGCDPTVTDKVCAFTGVCGCTHSRTVPPVPCAAECGKLPCDDVGCGLGDDPTSCTCAIGDSYVTCGI